METVRLNCTFLLAAIVSTILCDIWALVSCLEKYIQIRHSHEWSSYSWWIALNFEIAWMWINGTACENPIVESRYVYIVFAKLIDENDCILVYDPKSGAWWTKKKFEIIGRNISPWTLSWLSLNSKDWNNERHQRVQSIKTFCVVHDLLAFTSPWENVLDSDSQYIKVVGTAILVHVSVPGGYTLSHKLSRFCQRMTFSWSALQQVARTDTLILSLSIFNSITFVLSYILLWIYSFR